MHAPISPGSVGIDEFAQPRPEGLLGARGSCSSGTASAETHEATELGPVHPARPRRRVSERAHPSGLPLTVFLANIESRVWLTPLAEGLRRREVLG